MVQGIVSQTDKVSAESFNRRVKTETSLRLVWAPPGARYLNLDSWTTTYRKLLCTQNTPNNHWVLTAHRYLRILQVACTNLTCWLYACNTNMDPLYWTIHHPLTSLRTQICFEWKINKWGGCCGSDESHWSLIVPPEMSDVCTTTQVIKLYVHVGNNLHAMASRSICITCFFFFFVDWNTYLQYRGTIRFKFWGMSNFGVSNNKSNNI